MSSGLFIHFLLLLAAHTARRKKQPFSQSTVVNAADEPTPDRHPDLFPEVDIDALPGNHYDESNHIALPAVVKEGCQQVPRPAQCPLATEGGDDHFRCGQFGWVRGRHVHSTRLQQGLNHASSRQRNQVQQGNRQGAPTKRDDEHGEEGC